MNVNKLKYERFLQALSRLLQIIEHRSGDHIDAEIIRDATVQRFEFTLEQAWKAMQVYLIDEIGTHPDDLSGPKKVIREGAKSKIISMPQIWLEMIDARNKLSHRYDEEMAMEYYRLIKTDYGEALIEWKTIVSELIESL